MGQPHGKYGRFQSKNQCDTTDEFMRVVKVVLDKADPKIVKYADIAIHD